MKLQIRAMIWDMGGVILRTEDQTPREQLAKKLFMTKNDLVDMVFNSESAKLATNGTITENEHWNWIRSRLNLTENQLFDFQSMFWEGDRLDKDLMYFIESLRPRFMTGLLSNAWSGARKALDEKYAGLDYFDHSMFSCEVGCSKPDPQIYKLLLKRMGVQPVEAVFVDDFKENVEAAISLGIHGIPFQTREQVISEINLLTDWEN